MKAEDYAHGEAGQDLFQLVAENAPVMLWMGDAHGKCIYLNKAQREFWGLAPEQISTFDWNTSLHPDDQQKLYEPFGKGMREHTPFAVEARYRRADGEYRILRTQAHPRFGSRGEFLGMIGVNVDITQMRTNEEELRKAKEQREFVFALAERQRALRDPDEIMRVTAEALARHLGSNRAGFYRVVGEEVIVFGPDWTDGSMPSLTGQTVETATLGEGYNRLARRGESIVSANTRAPGDVGQQAGRFGAVAGIASPMLRQGRWTSGIFASCAAPRDWKPEEVALVEEVAETSWDNVERAEAEEALREYDQRAREELEQAVLDRTAALKASEARVRTVFETSYQFQGLMALDGTLLDANPVSLKAILCALEDVVGKKFWATPWFTDTPGMSEMVREAVALVAQGEVVQREIAINLPTGRRIFDFSMRPVRDEEGHVVGIVPEATELTERRQAEDQLRQSQKMEAVGQLTGGIAHDFNNMLAVVIGGLNLLQRRLARGDTDVNQYIEAAMEGAMRASSLTQRLLAFSRQQPLKPEPIDANRMVADMSELLARTLGETVKIETVLSAGLWKSNVDLLQLENVILNLAVNARDAMPEGGKLTIETANAYIDEYYGRENQITPGQYIQIAVTDTGEGMTADVMTRAFDPFFTTKSVGKGTGLGLSQVFGFIRQSGGLVKLYSEVGVGTTVKVYLPRYHGDAAVVMQKAQGSVSGGSADEVILVVEDEERVRNYSVEALRELGYSVVQASCGADALRLIDDGQNISLLFTDVVMPEMTGRQLAELATRKVPGLKVLFTTGYSRNAVVHNGVLDYGTNYLPKPFSMDQLAMRVRAILDGTP